MTNYNKDVYESWFEPNVDYTAIKNHEGGRYIGTTPEIEMLRPKTPSN